jgi:XTP/dITP diphosphohydrolase
VTTILIATRNAHKVGEIRAILGGQFQFLTLNDFPNAPKVVEDADTFAGNAAKKAVELARWIQSSEFKVQGSEFFVLADDSGLEVDMLDGKPGVFSARFAAWDRSAGGSSANSPDADNNAKLLHLLKNVPAEKRTARFRCVIALVPVPRGKIDNASPVCYADELESQGGLFDGACEGKIILEPRGRNGFGYDPLFAPDGFEQTFAELGDEVKNRLSHRARALGKLKQKLPESLKADNWPPGTLEQS